MSLFPNVIAASLSGRSVKAAYLVEFLFRSGPQRLWNGNGDLSAGARVWKGLRGLGQISGLEAALNANAPQAVFSVSGVSSGFRSKDGGDPFDYINRPIIVYVQFFKDDWSTLDDPYAISGWVMQTVHEGYAWDDSVKAWVSTVGIAAESWFFGRGRPPFSFWSDRDQQARYPGDKGLEYMSALQNYVTRWPDL